MNRRTVKQALHTITLAHMQQYLQAHGWIRSQTHEQSDLWIHPAHDAEILLPRNPAVADYELRLGDALKVLHHSEQRSFDALLADLQAPSTSAPSPPPRRWECVRCGEVDDDDVCVMPDGTAWHIDWGQCGADCVPLRVSANDAQQWAEDGIQRFRALADEIQRLRTALTVIADLETASPAVRSLARRALRGEPLEDL